MSAEVPAPHPVPEQFPDGFGQPPVVGDGFEQMTPLHQPDGLEPLPDQGDGFELPEPVDDGLGQRVTAEDDGFGSTSNAQFNYPEPGERREGGDGPIHR